MLQVLVLISDVLPHSGAEGFPKSINGFVSVTGLSREHSALVASHKGTQLWIQWHSTGVGKEGYYLLCSTVVGPLLRDDLLLWPGWLHLFRSEHVIW